MTRNAPPAGNEITWCPAVNVVVGEVQARISTGWRLIKFPSVPVTWVGREVSSTLTMGPVPQASATGVDREGEGAARVSSAGTPREDRPTGSRIFGGPGRPTVCGPVGMAEKRGTPRGT